MNAPSTAAGCIASLTFGTRSRHCHCAVACLSRRLRFTTDAAVAVGHGTLVFIAVGIPPAADGSADLVHLLAAARTIGLHMLDDEVVVDGRNLHVPRPLAEQGFEHQGVGSGCVNPPSWLSERHPLLRQALAA